MLNTSISANDLMLKGKILNQNTKEPLMFANMTVGTSSLGTTTDIDGQFELNITEEYAEDSLYITMINYKDQNIAISDLRDQKGEVIFLLEPSAFEFTTIEIGTSIILNDIFFEHNKHILLDESYPALEKLYNILTRNPKYKIEIAGHTDNTGEDDYNAALSEARAGAVMEWLEEQGIESLRLTARGYGESMPISTNETELGKQQNRRVEFKITEKNFNPFDEKKKLIVIGGGQIKGGGTSISTSPKEKKKKEKKPKAIFLPKGETVLNATNFKKITEKSLKDKKFHGVVLYSKDGKAESQVYGSANLTYDIPNKANTRFYIGSLAEQFTAVLTLRLVQQKKLELTDPIGQFLPNYPNTEVKKQITIGHLLSHTSGLINEQDLKSSLSQNGKQKEADFIAAFANKKLVHAPGTKYTESALNYYLLALIIEKVEEKDFEMLLKKDIFEKSNMMETQALNLTTIDKNRARNYVNQKGVYSSTIFSASDLVWGSNNLVSTLTDLERWDTTLRNNTLLDEQHTKMLFKENLDGASFFGTISKGKQTKKSVRTGSDVFYTYTKGYSFFVISNVSQSGAKEVVDSLVK